CFQYGVGRRLTGLSSSPAHAEAVARIVAQTTTIPPDVSVRMATSGPTAVPSPRRVAAGGGKSDWLLRGRPYARNRPACPDEFPGPLQPAGRAPTTALSPFGSTGDGHARATALVRVGGKPGVPARGPRTGAGPETGDRRLRDRP